MRGKERAWEYSWWGQDGQWAAAELKWAAGGQTDKRTIFFAMEECWGFLTAEAYLTTQRPACSQANSTAVSVWHTTSYRKLLRWLSWLNRLIGFTRAELWDGQMATDCDMAWGLKEQFVTQIMILRYAPLCWWGGMSVVGVGEASPKKQKKKKVSQQNSIDEFS